MKFQKIYCFQEYCSSVFPASSCSFRLYPRMSWLCRRPIHIYLTRVLGSDSLYPCVLDALWVSQRQSVRVVIDAKFQSRQVESHKLQSMWWWSGSMRISIPIHCGFIAYLLFAHGKHFTNNIYTSHALVFGSFSSVLLVNAVFGVEQQWIWSGHSMSMAPML